MHKAIKQKAIVKPGWIVEVRAPELPPGAVADVIVILETSPNKTQSLTNLIGTDRGGFATPQEVDDFISRERDAWSS